MPLFFVDPEMVVYRCYDAAGDLLYVGCTGRLRRRINEHHHTELGSAWASRIARIETEPPVGSTLARKIERRQIINLAPRFNRMANRKRGWDYQRGNGPGGGGIAYFPAQDQFRIAA